MIRLPDFLASVRSEVSPHLDLLSAIEEKAGTDLEGAEHELAALIANMIRAQNPDVHRELAAIRAQLDDITTKLETISMSQASIDADVTALTTALTSVQGVVTDIAADQATLVTDLQAIQAQLASGGTVDTSALDALVTNAQGVQSAAQSAQASLDATVANITTVAGGTTPPPAPSGTSN